MDNPLDNLPPEMKNNMKELGGFVGTPAVGGAILGSIVPVIGTGVGMGIGAVAGSVAFLLKKNRDRPDS